MPWFLLPTDSITDLEYDVFSQLLPLALPRSLVLRISPGITRVLILIVAREKRSSPPTRLSLACLY